MRYLCFFGVAVLSVVLVDIVLCQTDPIEEEAVWGSEPEGTTEVEKSSTDVIERSLDLRSSDDNKNSVDDDSSKTLEQTLKQVDLSKLMQKDKTLSSLNESKNIQRVAKRLYSNLEETMAMQNITSSDIGWLTRVFNIILWDPNQLPGNENLSVGCNSQFRQYLRALHNGSLWASKGKGMIFYGFVNDILTIITNILWALKRGN